MDNKEEIKGKKTRGNGQGSITKLDDGRYRAMITVDVYATKDDTGKLVCRRSTRSRICRTKKEAAAALVELRVEYEREKNGGLNRGQTPTLSELYDAWYDYYVDSVGPSTMECYAAAFKHLKSLHNTRMGDITITDLQSRIDNCPKGKRTRENMKALIGLLYKYGIPRHLTGDSLNLGSYLRLNYDKTREGVKRQSLTDEELASLFELADAGDVDAQIICIACFMGWRPDELLSLQICNVDLKERVITGGSKTAAGIDRPVPIHDRVFPYIEAIIGDRKEGYVFGNLRYGGTKRTLKRYREYRFYPTLERAGIDNPFVPAGGGTMRHRITPHSCRHTFARLLKGVKDTPVQTKLDIIGHTDRDQLEDYMDSPLPERRRVIDMIDVSFLDKKKGE